MTSEEGSARPAARCACSFIEQPDETLTDHLLAVCTPEDNIGPDGQVHLETTGLTCQCGFLAAAPAGLDEHFLAVFTAGKPVMHGKQEGPRLDASAPAGGDGEGMGN